MSGLHGEDAYISLLRSYSNDSKICLFECTTILKRYFKHNNVLKPKTSNVLLGKI